MTIRNQDWYNENESRPYPVSDEATNRDDEGLQLPGDLIVDLHITYPFLVGERLYLTAVTNTATLVSAIIVAVDDLDAPTTFTPLASINLPKPFDAYRTYPLEEIYPGIIGWIVFGNEAARSDPNVEVYSGRFTNPRQSVLCPSVCFSVDALPIADVGKLNNSEPLTGLVRLSGGNNIEIVSEPREIPGEPISPNIQSEPLTVTMAEKGGSDGVYLKLDWGAGAGQAEMLIRTYIPSGPQDWRFVVDKTKTAKEEQAWLITTLDGDTNVFSGQNDRYRYYFFPNIWGPTTISADDAVVVSTISGVPPTFFNQTAPTSRDSRQAIRIGEGVYGGSFTLTFNGETTEPISWNPTTTEIQSKLQALSTIDGVGGTVSVTYYDTWYPAASFVVRFAGSFESTEQPLMSYNASGLLSSSYVFDTVRNTTVIIRLKESTLGSGSALVPATTGSSRTNVFEAYCGPCAGRPESHTCGDPQPIEQLGGVTPDCCGNISLVFQGCATISDTNLAIEIDPETSLSIGDSPCQGVIIDCNLGLSDACLTPDRLPDEDGRLPNEYDDLCESLSSISISITNPTPDPTFSVDEAHEDSFYDSGLPDTVDFNGAPQDDLLVLAGRFLYMYECEGDGTTFLSTEAPGGGSSRSMVAIPGTTVSPYYRIYSAKITIKQRRAQSGLHNAMVFGQARETGEDNRIWQHLFAEIDYDGSYYNWKMFRVGQFTGTRYKTLAAVPVPTLALDVEYVLSLKIYPVLDGGAISNNEAFVGGTLTCPDDEDFDDIEITPVFVRDTMLYIPNPGDHNGYAGVGGNRSWIRCSEFTVDNTGEAP
jgi:hypothetical protein